MKIIIPLLTLAFCAIMYASPKGYTENQPIKTIPIGYNLGKVGKDSVLVIQGKYVRQFGGKVYVKIN